MVSWAHCTRSYWWTIRWFLQHLGICVSGNLALLSIIVMIMEWWLTRTKQFFFAINNTHCDKVPLKIEGHVIRYCDRYKYLGAWFTDSGRMKDVLSLHEVKCQSVVNKFSISCASNPDMPYWEITQAQTYVMSNRELSQFTILPVSDENGSRRGSWLY